MRAESRGPRGGRGGGRRQGGYISGRHDVASAPMRGVMACKTLTEFVLCHPHVVHSADRERSLTLALSGPEGQVQR